jgi:tetratricopeptide (TPR) repeat protein
MERLIGFQKGLAVWLVCVLVLVGARLARAGTDNKNVDIGKDPLAFASAEQMHNTAPDADFDQRAAALISVVDEALAAGETLEGSKAWAALIQLEPYRKTVQVQAAAQKWVKAVNLSATQPLTDPETFRQGNSEYRRSLEKASEIYKKALLESANHMDSRNNLGLAQMHLNHDLVAQLELEICRVNFQEYIPALINLTVVYERLGQFDAARKNADLAYAKEKELASVVFNDAWYQSITGDWNASDKELSSLPDKSAVKDKRDSLGDLNAELYIDAGGLFRKGLGRVLGSKRSTTTMGISILLFAAGAGALIWLVTRIGGRYGYGARQTAAFWLHLPLAAGWYVLMWGCPLLMWGRPLDGWWAALIAWAVVSSAISSLCTAK